MSSYTTDMPDFPFFAVIKEDIVIGCCFQGVDGKMYSPINKSLYNDEDMIFIPMVLENSPASIGMKYDKTNNKFFEGEINA